MSTRKKDQPYSSQLRGIAALLGTAPSPTPAAPSADPSPPAADPNPASPRTLPLSEIHLPPEQPRRYFDPDKLAQLAQSIQNHGILEPLLVRPRSEAGGGGYELVAGERRLRAARSLDLAEVPVVIRDLSEDEARSVALIENLQREDLNPVEETEGILKLLALQLDLSPDAVVALLYRMRNETIGNSNQNVLISPEGEVVQGVFAALATLSWESFTTTRLPLLKLPPEILDALRSGQLAYTKAQAIARLKDPEQRQSILDRAIAQHWSLAQIKAAIQALPQPEKSPPKSSPSLKQRADQAFRQVKRSPIWTDPQRKKQVEKLVKLLEDLATADPDPDL
ncbi:MAG: ParB/RepB/Spo0J family partition protein [Prochlorothrix sp.]|nr:ParB/RepB/Spo0J family partition protein [Prochlorothrix sp.]